MPKRMTVHLEGWRYYSQSLALVNQYQALELLNYSELSLCHRDLPPPPASMLRKGTTWARVAKIIGADEDRLVRAIPLPDPAHPPEVTYRIGFPYDFSPAPRGRTLVFAITETGNLPAFLVKGPTLAEATGRGVKIVTSSEFSRRGLIASGAEPAQVAVVPHGYDPLVFAPVEAEERQRIRAGLGWRDRFVCLAVGAMYPHKGILTLLKGFAAVVQRYPLALLVLKGNDSAYDSHGVLERVATNLSPAERARLQPALRYLGRSCSSRELARLYQGSDVLLAPYHAEGFNLPVLEAAACGLPVICTAGGPTDETSNQEFALRIPSVLGPSPVKAWGGNWLYPDRDAFVALLERVMGDGAFLARARVAGPAHVADRYPWNKVVKRLLDELH